MSWPVDANSVDTRDLNRTSQGESENSLNEARLVDRSPEVGRDSIHFCSRTMATRPTLQHPSGSLVWESPPQPCVEESIIEIFLTRQPILILIRI
jgi:hypothetical protein